MKSTLFLASIFLLLITGGRVSAADTWVETYDGLLQKYVTSTGVRYSDWHDDKPDLAALAGVVKAISKEQTSGKSKDEQLAYYINAYNAWILHLILEDYPTKGPGGGGLFGRTKFFKSENLTVAGEKISFSALENDIIRPTFKEPRIHFALNCASTSCPPLHTKVFRAETLDADLTALTKAFINDNPLGVSITGGKAEVSKIFDWYGEDFTGGVLTYLNKYLTNPIPLSTKIDFQDYLWTLNQAR